MNADLGGESFRLLFVCTGNTCRSPLAEAIARAEIEELGWRGVEVRSAGAAAHEGLPASTGSLASARRHGLDLTSHRTRALTPQAVEWANLILVMGPGHLERALELGGDGRTALLSDFVNGEDADQDDAGVPDPFGGDDEAYEETYETLSALVGKALRRLEPILSP